MTAHDPLTELITELDAITTESPLIHISTLRRIIDEIREKERQ